MTDSHSGERTLGVMTWLQSATLPKRTRFYIVMAAGFLHVSLWGQMLAPAYGGVGGAVENVGKNCGSREPAVTVASKTHDHFVQVTLDSHNPLPAPVVEARSQQFQLNDRTSGAIPMIDPAVVAVSWDTFDEEFPIYSSGDEEFPVDLFDTGSPMTCRIESENCQPCLPDLVTVDPSQNPYQPIGPWPGDEYICDGGDYSQQVRVRADWTVDGLEMEDTVAHFDTLDGRTIVEPTGRVCIYAPRFAAVRRVSGVSEHKQQEQMNEILMPLQPELGTEVQIASTTLQQAQPILQVGRQPANIFRDLKVLESLDRPQELGTLADKYLPHENLRVFRYGIFDETERLLLTEFSDAAEAWSHDAAVQAVIEDVPAIAEVLYQQPHTLYKLDPQGKPKLCVAKTASRKSALPGDVIDFTLRFDNVGNERIGNVTLIDNLSPRLEYVPKSAQCSLDAQFFTRENEGESLVLRWEIKQPLKPGQGGLIRFRCKVR